MDQLVYHYLESVMGNPTVRGACLNVGLGAGMSARLMLQSRLVTRVSSLELSQSVVDAYRANFPENEALESRHTIVVGDAANPTQGMITAINPPFDAVYVDMMMDQSESSFAALRNVVLGCKNGLLKPGGALFIEYHGDNPQEREFKIWIQANFTIETVRDALAPTGRRMASPMRIYRPKP